MRIFYCEVCNARVSPEDIPLGAEPYDETRTVHFCDKHRPAIPAVRPKGNSNPGLRAISNTALKAVGNTSNSGLKAAGSGLSPRPGGSNAALKSQGSSSNPAHKAVGGSGMGARPRAPTPSPPRSTPKGGAQIPPGSNPQLRSQKPPVSPLVSPPPRRTIKRRVQDGDIMIWFVGALVLVTVLLIFVLKGRDGNAVHGEKRVPVKPPESASK
ncbi:MAG TPA: hypothetical protein VEK08_08930 [Planctomycetota bacterium]|nr:hypothetical protein [Planctomycetota bacterium]